MTRPYSPAIFSSSLAEGLIFIARIIIFAARGGVARESAECPELRKFRGAGGGVGGYTQCLEDPLWRTFPSSLARY